MAIRALADCDASCGGKAHGLARAIAAGLPVPDGFVVEPSVFRGLVGERGRLDEAGHQLALALQRVLQCDLPAELIAEVQRRADALGGPLAVRSSATIEDTASGAAPGLFQSNIGVRATDVWTFIRGVWTSALTPVAAAYAKAAFDLAVIVQRGVRGGRATVYTRPPGRPDDDQVWLQQGDELVKRPRVADHPLVALALAAEAAIDAKAGADVELVVGDDHAWVVQVRPIVHPRPHVRTPPPPVVLAALVADGRRWTWDVAHNPDPLSPAQASLVERVERAGVAPWSLRVCAGYLYSTPLGEPRAPDVSTRAELEARVAAIEAEFARVLADDRVDPIERYVAFYKIWATELVPLIRAARSALTPELLAGARPSAVEVTLLAAARGELDEAGVLARIGVMSPAWDVAVPTFAEQPFVVRHAITRAKRTLALVPAQSVVEHPPASELARAAADLAERDDVWFARAQWLVRKAILERAGELGDDAFWLPVDDLQVLDLEAASRRASAARAAASRAADWDMPLVVGEAPENKPLLVGVGSGGRATGRVVRLVSLASRVAIGRSDVVVTRAVTPAVAVIVVGCAALVSETGGPLDYGAAMARELGIPCVVGCRGAWTQLSDGMLVTVDAETGAVTY